MRIMHMVDSEFVDWGAEMVLKERLRAFYGFWLDLSHSPLVNKEFSAMYFVAAADNHLQGSPGLETNAHLMSTFAHQHSREVAEWGGTALLAQVMLTFCTPDRLVCFLVAAIPCSCLVHLCVCPSSICCCLADLDLFPIVLVIFTCLTCTQIHV
jgi:hypothetical protein